MQKNITATSSITGLGESLGRKLFKVSGGQYYDRLAAIVQTGPNDIKLAYADRPYSSWSEWQSVADDCDEGAFDCLMDSAGNIHVVYTEQTTLALVTKKLLFSSGGWAVGSKVTIYDGSGCYSPSANIEPGGDLWVSYSRLISPNKQVYAKSSSDGGASWGSGSSDPGVQISATALYAYSRVVMGLNDIHIIYTLGGTQLSIRSRPLTGGDWTSAYTLATGNGLTYNFDAAVGPDGLLAVVFSHDDLQYREYDGSNWGAIVTLAAGSKESPQVLFRQNIPVIVFLDTWAGSQKTIKYIDRQTGVFSAPQILDPHARPFDGVILYDKVSESYADRTDQAQSATAADVYHPASGCLLKSSGDIIYLGMDDRFRYVEFTLSTPGGGGTVGYSYWDGSNWTAITPTGDNPYLDAAGVALVLWSDYAAFPVDWQKRIVNGENRFWVKIEVASAYTTGPVADRVAAVSFIEKIIFRR
ncbi:MAG: hypothetical protein JXA92_02470 [candidate division Zixibacteria bacterium]|nr:hypothetical protein [candidate division Zixibacteria bacterium]